MESNFLKKSTNKSAALVFFFFLIFLHEHLMKFDGLSEFVILWINFYESYFGFSLVANIFFTHPSSLFIPNFHIKR